MLAGVAPALPPSSAETAVVFFAAQCKTRPLPPTSIEISLIVQRRSSLFRVSSDCLHRVRLRIPRSNVEVDARTRLRVSIAWQNSARWRASIRPSVAARERGFSEAYLSRAILVAKTRQKCVGVVEWKLIPGDIPACRFNNRPSRKGIKREMRVTSKVISLQRGSRRSLTCGRAWRKEKRGRRGGRRGVEGKE